MDPSIAAGRRSRADAVLRPMEEGDVTRVAGIEKDTFSTPWKAETFGNLLARSGVEVRVVELPGRGVVAYAVLWCVQDQAELANIAVLEGHRGAGLGSLLLDEMLALARARGVRTLYLEVRVSNERAARMYRARGFEEIGRRRGYYQHPKEDARVLMKRL